MNWLRVCDDCALDHCVNCSGTSDPMKCQECEIGYFYDEELQACGDCDDNAELKKCIKCSGYGNKCEECAEGFRLATEGRE